LNAPTIAAFVVLFFLGCAGAPAPTPPTAQPAATLAATVTRSVSPTRGALQATATRALTTPDRAANTPTLPAPTQNPPTATRLLPTETATTVPPTPSPAPLTALEEETRAGWERFAASLEANAPANAQARVDEFWNAVVRAQRVPLVLDDTVILLYRGEANSVAWRGDFSYWQFGMALDGRRVKNTDLWHAAADFPRDSRTDYKIVLDGNKWILDPANPAVQGGGLGDNSVLTMPDFRVTDFTERRAEVPQGTLTDWITFDSAAWGAPVNYRVYTPPNYDALEELPVLYVTDGNDFSDERMGAMQIVLDNRIADGKIPPLIAVFVDARDPNNLRSNQREIQFLARPEEFAEMITTEAVTTIDARYRTDASRDARALVGTSYGGVFATFAGLKYPGVFGKLAIFSPAYWVFDTPDGTGGADLAVGARRMSGFVQAALQSGGGDTPRKIFMSRGISNWDVGDLEFMAKPLRERGNMVKVYHVQEGHSWGAWSGLTDEMLEYLFGE
jgi:enterochelin esterase family protein